MEKESIPSHPDVPAECFQMEALSEFQSFEGFTLANVVYYLWLNQGGEASQPYRFIYYVELVFEENRALLLSSGEDSAAIQLGTAEELVETAKRLQELHGVVGIQRVQAGNFPLWQPALGQVLQAFRLSKHPSGFYYNDAVVLDFGKTQIMISIGAKEGLEIAPFQ